MNIYLYGKENCPLCDEAEQLISLFQDSFSFTLEKRDIYTNEEWLAAYQLEIPVLEVADRIYYGEKLNYKTLHDVFTQYLAKK